MRIKILMLGANPVSLMADSQLLRERGLLVITAFNLQNINEMVTEVRPDIVFFDPAEPNNAVTDAYNLFVANPQFTQLPVIFTLSDDDIYLVTRDRMSSKDQRALIADNIIDAVKMALEEKRIAAMKTSRKIHTRTGSAPAVRTGLLFG